jgi:ABC-type polysaccharide/polyol phosphate transport system ATPase subunit
MKVRDKINKIFSIKSVSSLGINGGRFDVEMARISSYVASIGTSSNTDAYIVNEPVTVPDTNQNDQNIQTVEVNNANEYIINILHDIKNQISNLTNEISILKENSIKKKDKNDWLTEVVCSFKLENLI